MTPAEQRTTTPGVEQQPRLSRSGADSTRSGSTGSGSTGSHRAGSGSAGSGNAEADSPEFDGTGFHSHNSEATAVEDPASDPGSAWRQTDGPGAARAGDPTMGALSSGPRTADASRAELIIDLAAVRANVAHLIEACAPAHVMIVVKADGYGHGMVPVAKAARQSGAGWLGVAFLSEALALRAAGDTGRVLCWLAVPGEDYRAGVAAEVDLTAYSVAQVEAIAAAATDVGTPARLQLKVDTGLSRGGASLAEWAAVVQAARDARDAGSVRVTGVWSHLACADEPDHPANDAQHHAFIQALDVAAVLDPDIVHLANSAAALTRPQARYDLVRCGIAAYGLSPAPTVGTPADFGLRPAMTARTRVAVSKRVAAGSGVSYGHQYRTEADTRVVVVPVGYGEGIPVTAAGAPVHIAGQRHRVVGRVCMDQFALDVGDCDIPTGSEVVLFGTGESGEPTAQDWAEACGTINYEIVTRIGGRFARTYRGLAEGTDGVGR